LNHRLTRFLFLFHLLSLAIARHTLRATHAYQRNYLASLIAQCQPLFVNAEDLLSHPRHLAKINTEPHNTTVLNIATEALAAPFSLGEQSIPVSQASHCPGHIF
jgi:hypothetical protein